MPIRPKGILAEQGDQYSLCQERKLQQSTIMVSDGVSSSWRACA